MKIRRNCSIKLLFVSAICFACHPLFAASSSANDWTASNNSIQISIDTKTGVIDHLIDPVSHEDYCNQSLSNATADQDGNRGLPFTIKPRIGGLLLWDELQNKVFGDMSDPGRISNVKSSADSLSFDKQYPGAQFVVRENFQLGPNGLRWDVRLHKTAGADRSVRVVYELPLPLGGEAWAPIAEAPFAVKPWLPFSIDYGQSTAGAIGEGEWRTTLPLMVFYSKRKDRALAIASPLEVPAVRTRFLSNTGALADFYWNSREYPARERPYFQVSNENLGMRTSRDLQTGLLVTTQPANWRPALGWFYSMYKPYFDPSPDFAKWDGAYAGGDYLMDPKLTTDQVKALYAKEYQRGVRWEEYHSPYAHYGQMIPPPDVKSWVDISDPNEMQPTLTRAKIEEHCKLSREAGIGTFLYYNTTEAEYWYAQQNFPESIAKSEAGGTIAAWRGVDYPSKRACWLMNSDPSTGFGKSMIDEAKQMVESYPDAAGFFWDVYGRSYMFDFAHDDGITMVNNKPAYYPEFMYRRLLDDYVGPTLHAHGMTITANKPVTVYSTKGIDGIMTMEDAPDEVSPGWITAQSYLGLNRHVMILDDNGANAEMLYLHCLRYGAFNSMIQDVKLIKHPNWQRIPLSPSEISANRDLESKYQPFVNMFKGKKWIFYPHALDLPQDTYGNIFQLENGDVMITMVSVWRSLHHDNSFDTNLQVIARLPNMSDVKSVEVDSVDMGDKTTVSPQRDGNQLTITVPKHGKATVILLHMEG